MPRTSRCPLRMDRAMARVFMRRRILSQRPSLLASACVCSSTSCKGRHAGVKAPPTRAAGGRRGLHSAERTGRRAGADARQARGCKAAHPVLHRVLDGVVQPGVGAMRKILTVGS